MAHTLDTIGESVEKLRRFRDDSERAGDPLVVTVGGPVETLDDVQQWEAAGVDRLIVSPWAKSRDAVAGLGRFAGTIGV
jgi:hypothetical protein